MSDMDDIKAKMREALARKKANDRGVEDHSHRKQRSPKNQGPMGGVHMHRRKAGGGGS